MPAVKPVVWFVLRLVLIYALLMVPWPGLRDAYAAVFRAGGNLVFGSLGPDRSASLKPLSDPRTKCDTVLVLRVKRAGRSMEARGACASRLGYVPTAFLLALILATRMPWRRRCKALLLGLLMVNIVVLVTVGLLVLKGLSTNLPPAVALLSPFGRKAVAEAAHLMTGTWSVFVVPILIWLLVAFRRADWVVAEGSVPRT